MNFPYYYKRIIGNSTEYGKIEDGKFTVFEDSRHNDRRTFKIESHEFDSLEDFGLTAFLEKKYLSSQAEFETAKMRAITYIDNI